MKKIHAGIVELAVVGLFDYRRNHCVPNVSWGWALGHEADLIVVDQNLKVTEVEIKVSLSDLKADFRKINGHRSSRIGRMYYAIPEYLVEKGFPLIPKEFGVIVVKEVHHYGIGEPQEILTTTYKAMYLRQCRHRKGYEGITKDQLLKLLDLGCMRIWSLKRHNNRQNG